MAGSKRNARIEEQLARWREEIINLARTNRLIYFRHLKTGTLEITAPAVAPLLQRLDTSGWSIFLPPDPDDGELLPTSREPRPDELVTDKQSPRQIQNSLTTLARRTEQEFMDKGLWVLYLGVGILNWIDADDQQAESPLLLVPVALSRASPREPYRLVRADEDATVNPALAVKLGEFGVALPQMEEVEERGVEWLLSAVGRKVRGRKGWSVAPRVVLGTFSFQKEVMYRDLLNNEEQIVGHPLVASLALGSAGETDEGLDFDPVPEEELDDKAPPEDMATILNADASQRQCIAAASQGHSFVMDGPPGTGKSQTIANMIAELLLRGRTVLFVSEKAAALEVVQKRLKQSGLDDFVLELHSHKATRREVAQALARPLRHRQTPGRPLAAADRSRLIKRRQALSAHAAAMNEVRDPLGMSLQQAIGRVAQLSGAPRIPPAKVNDGLSAEELAETVDQATRLSNAWGPVLRGDDFLWREPSEAASDPAARTEVAEQLHAAGHALAQLGAVTREAADELDVTWWRTLPDARRLGLLVDRLLAPVPVESGWLTTDSLTPARRRIARLTKESARWHALTKGLAERAGASWRDLDPDAHERMTGALEALERSPLDNRPSADAMRGVIRERQRILTESAELMTDAVAFATEAAAPLGHAVDSPRLEDARRLAQVVQLFAREPKPEAAWLSAEGFANAQKAVAELRPLVEQWIAKRDALAGVFSEAVLELDLEGLRVRFDTVHRGLRKLRGAYREDKRALAGVARAQRVDEAVLAALPEALEWKKLAAQLEAAETRHAAILAEHYRREDTDFTGLTTLLEAAAQGIRLTDGRGFEPTAAASLGRGGTLDAGLVDRSGRLLERSERWQALTGDEAPLVKALKTWTCEEAQAACAKDAAPLGAVEALVDTVSAMAGRELPVGEVTAIAESRAQVASIERDFEETHAESQRLLGERYRRQETDWEELQGALSWADDVRGAVGGALDERQVRHFLSAPLPSGGVSSFLESWDRERSSLEAWFAASRREEVHQELDGAFEDASQLIDALERTLGDLDEWDAYSRASEWLKKNGFAKGLAQLRKQRVPAEEVPAAIERSCLEAWIEAVLKSDATRLQPELLSSDRDKLLDEFRRLDHELIERKASEVIEACNARRPRGTAGAAGIILREAEKKRRHMPVRKLLADTGGLALQLKPCFFMSPLTVSQFLPADVRFDAVIFDEASQVRPADAINCIYRGDQLIVAGDQRQLPPTSFFERYTQEDGDEYQEDQLEEFDSILDLAKGSGSLRALSLRWHYRSKHESLITYSNYCFYEGRLISFPGAIDDAEDVGVKLYPVQGVYRRGGARDNPVEAAAVAERVLFHARTHRNLTVGVVAFSEAQASAIEAELDRQRLAHPELDGFFDADRLDGFFIKNLENVQGDERDVIIFSVGYGPDEAGKLTMGFGPLNNVGGQRRLNVAVTRARRRVEVVASISASDIRHDVPNEGARHLRGYLDFAERGPAALALEVGEGGRDVESPFEEEVARVLRSWGHEVVPQVGTAGYRIDLAIRHPEHPGRFVLGIECDGAMYHSSRVARDRDRLRQEVLEGLGWRIHRIWGTSWYRDRDGQEQRLRTAIEEALEDAPARTKPKPRPAIEEPAFEVLDHDGPPAWTEPYLVRVPSAPTMVIDMHEHAAQSDIKRMVMEVVSVEAPVLAEVVLRRVREGWGLQRTGPRIREAFEKAVGDLRRRGQLARDQEGFLWANSSDGVPVRVPTEDEPDSVRDVSEVPARELEQAVHGVVSDALRIEREELSVRVARLFGWGRRGTGISNAIDGALERLIARGEISEAAPGWLGPAESAPSRDREATG